jgi:hypothetical protein
VCANLFYGFNIFFHNFLKKWSTKIDFVSVMCFSAAGLNLF